ncbi:leucine--tRNA ligase [Candidatus Wolfebacteria bacterium]|nr:leucine--tRNA ligase [Candidatus Wolfebacteria bacterium]
MERYNHKEIEKRWQKKWKEQKLYETPDTVEGKDNFYTLVEFPYPSGNLHVGHWFAYIGPDIFARFMRMQGKNVLFPIGFDAFGLPAENAAIKRGINPREWTYSNIAYMRQQFEMMGTSLDWSREIISCDPRYYRWTQWLFLQFFKKGLAYQKETEVNWCPSCKTVLANEQVVTGVCERCGTEVEKRQMLQWNLKITDYAERLIDDLEKLDWPEEIKQAQRHWIGRSEGALLTFTIQEHNASVEIFTTRPDTLFGATYLVLAPEHTLIESLKDKITNWDEVEAYRQTARKKTDIERTALGKEKTGVELQGITALNPGTQEEISVWVADYVLSHYGTGAIMAVPAHDERDFAFAQKFNLEKVCVIEPRSLDDFTLRKMQGVSGEEKITGRAVAYWPDAGETPEHGFKREVAAILAGKSVYVGEGTLVHSGKFDGITTQEAREAITKAVGGEMKTTYKLRDWTVSRQRYWGCPIPVIHCAKCGVVPVPEHDLPVVLPEIDDFIPTGNGKSPLAKVVDWVNVKCPECGGDAERETDTLDTFVDSSWYFLRYTDPHNDKEFASRGKQEAWMPVGFYSGGAEHTTMHLLYSRFFHKVLFDLGLVADTEPYVRRMNRGLILGPDGNKMSKSKGNVIDPDDMVERLGADTVRMYLAFIGPYNEVGAYPWNPDGVVGVRRFLERVHVLVTKIAEDRKRLKDVSGGSVLIHRTVRFVTEVIGRLKFNTAVAQLMIQFNGENSEPDWRGKLNNKGEWESMEVDLMALKMFLKLLAPFAPHLAEELWYQLGNTTSVHLEPWPEYDPTLVEEEQVTIVVQVNGKTRGEFEAAQDIDETDARERALTLPTVEKWLGGKEPNKVVYVPGRLVNIVV